MTLYQVITTLQDIAITQPNVRTATNGDIYEVMNGNPSVKYGVFHITQNNHQTFPDYDIYSLSLFYLDRNEDDDANTLQIQSIGKEVIDNIVKIFCEGFDADFPTITFTPFTQRFDDDTAGVFANIQLEVYKDWNCADIIGGIVKPVTLRNQDKTIQITESGIYEVTYDEGYTGLGKVVIDAELANTVQPVKSVEITQNTGVSVLPDAPYLSMGEVDVNVNIPTQGKSVDIQANGSYTIEPDEGYEYLEDVKVNVNIPAANVYREYNKNTTDIITAEGTGYDYLNQVEVKVDIPIQIEKNVEVNNIGTTGILPDEGYTAMEKVNVTFNYVPDEKPKIPNGLVFSGSTWEVFDMGEYDWSDVYNFNGLFQNCNNLKRIDNFPSDIVPYGGTYNMFYGTRIEEAPYFEMKYIGNTGNMFSPTNITTIPQYDMNNVLYVGNMFGGCANLTELPLLNWESVVRTENCFANCRSLTTVGGFQNLKANLDINNSPLTDESVSNIINYVYDFTANAETPDSAQGTLKLSSVVYNRISDELKTLATAKGWTITA